MGACLVKGNRLLSTGQNQVRAYNHPFPKKWINSVHAEQHAIVKALQNHGDDAVRGSTLYVSRVNNDGYLRNACPCSYCRSIIISVGIKTVYYTNEHGDWVKWKPMTILKTPS